jgi:hypothetical protein
MQIERRTEASAQARLLRPDIDEPDEQRRAIFGGAWGEKGAGQGEHRSTQHQPDTARGNRVCQGWSGARGATLRVTHPRWEPYGAVKLVDGLAGESPAGADCPVGTVVISGDGAGNQTVESPEVNVLVG